MVPKSSLFLCSLFAVLNSCLSANVLVLETFPSHSHHVWMRPLLYKLLEKGHNVTSLSPDIENDPPKNLTYLFMNDMYDEAQPMDFNNLSPFERFFALGTFLYDIFEAERASTGFNALLEYPDDFKFDLIIYDHAPFPGLLLFAAKFGYPPIVSVSAYPGIYITNEITGAPYFPAFVPNHYMDSVEDNFWDRLQSVLIYSMMIAQNKWRYYPAADSYIKSIIPNAKSLKEIEKSVKLSLVNFHPALNFVQPMMPSVIPVGCLQITEPRPLVADLQVIYARATKGVVLFSLGSNVKSEDLGIERIKEFLDAFSQMPNYTFLWKLDDTGLSLDLPKNVFIRQWLPQNDILADNRTLLFISHSGGLSTQESAWYGVPVLALPVMFGQYANAAQVVKLGMGLQMDVKTVDRNTLKSAIFEMIKNEKYRERAKSISRQLQDQPESSMERAMWWIDYVMRNPDMSFLKNEKLQEMNILITHSVDVIAFITLVFIAIVWIIFKLLTCICKARTKKSVKVKRP